jgi:hypothetical protein
MQDEFPRPDPAVWGLYDVPRARLEEIAMVSARAFTSQNDPIGNYMFELETGSPKWQQEFFRSLVTSAPVDAVLMAVSPALEGVSIWFGPQNKDATGGHDESSEAYQSCTPETRERIARVLSTIESLILECAPSEHWYLHLVAVEPPAMGRGLSSKLILPMLRWADRQGLPATLVTQHEGNIALYQHLGFSVVKSKMVPDSRLHFWFMQHNP